MVSSIELNVFLFVSKKCIEKQFLLQKNPLILYMIQRDIVGALSPMLLMPAIDTFVDQSGLDCSAAAQSGWLAGWLADWETGRLGDCTHQCRTRPSCHDANTVHIVHVCRERESDEAPRT